MSEESRTPDDPPPISNGTQEVGNPFQPTAIEEPESDQGQGNLPRYDATYWMVAILFTVLITGSTYVLPLLGPVVIGAVFAFIRVPLLRRSIKNRLNANMQRGTPTFPVASPLKMYFLSTAILTAAAIASSIAFVAICLPTSLLTLSINAAGQNDTGIAVAFVLGFAGALACFTSIFFTSLRLNA